MVDGKPQVTPVWVDYDGRHVIINTADGRLKDKNMQRDPRIAFSITDPDNPYRYLEVRGRVVERTTPAPMRTSMRWRRSYLGQDKYPFRQPGEVRVIYKVSRSAPPRCEHASGPRSGKSGPPWSSSGSAARGGCSR